MKIFSLESKKHLVVWSVVLGFAVNIVLNKITFKTNQCIPNPLGVMDGCVYNTIYGFPFPYWEGGFVNPPFDNLYKFNFIFWILIVFIILSLVRHFRKKNNQITKSL